MLQPGELVPHFDVRALDGSRVTYSSSIWQKRNLVLIALPDDGPASGRYVQRVQAHASELIADDTALVVTRDAIPGVHAPAVLVADRWGEIVHSAHAGREVDLPDPGELAAWVTFVQHQCPECQGEAR